MLPPTEHITIIILKHLISSNLIAKKTNITISTQLKQEKVHNDKI